MKKSVVISAIMAAALSATSANAAELVSNPGFETGNFSGWTQGGNTGATGVVTNAFATGAVNSGTYAAALGPVGSVGTLSQILTTVASSVYTISFSLKTSAGTPNSFLATFDGTPLLLAFNDLNASIPYVKYSFTRTASSNASALTFTFQQDPSFWYLDDVSVLGLSSAVPEPASWALMLCGFGAVGFAMRRRRQNSTNVQFA